MAAKTTTQQKPEPRWEILTRNKLGRETVHRHRAATAEAAIEAMLTTTGVDREQVVDAHRVDA